MAYGSKKNELTRIFFSEIEQSIHLLEAHEKGDFTEAAVIMALKRRSVPVLVPFGDDQRYDVMIADGSGNLNRMQVKTGRLDDGVVRVSEQTASVGELEAVNDDHPW